MTAQPVLFVITGFRGAGKTTFCRQLVEAARTAGWQVGGVLSPPVFTGSRRTEIHVENLASGEIRPLAARRDEETALDSGPHTRNWAFHPEALSWADGVLAGSTPTGLLVVDELGTLEFERGQGWQSGLAAVDSGDYRVALVVVRAELLGEALARWPDAHIVEIDTPEDSQQKAERLSLEFFPTHR